MFNILDENGDWKLGEVRSELLILIMTTILLSHFQQYEYHFTFSWIVKVAVKVEWYIETDDRE